MKQTAQTHNLSKRLLSLLLAGVMCLSMLPFQGLTIESNAASKWVANSKSLPDSYLSANGNIAESYCACGMAIGTHTANQNHWCCYYYAAKLYAHIWNTGFYRSDDKNLLRNISAENRRLTVGNLKQYLSQAVPGAILRIDADSRPLEGDNDGHSLVFLSINENGDGAYFAEGNYNGLGNARIANVTWSYLVDTYLSKDYKYEYIKYIMWPNAPAFSFPPEAEKNIQKFNQTSAIVDFYYKLAPGKSSAVVRSSPYNGGDSNKVGTLTSGEIHVTKSGWNTENHIWYYIGDGQFAGCYIYSENVTKVTGCTHNYQEHYEADHPHRVYKKCTKCGDYYYTGATKYLSSCSKCNPIGYVFDVNVSLNGVEYSGGDGWVTFDVYIAGNREANDVSDYYNTYISGGTSYKIDDIKPASGYNYTGKASITGTVSGTTTITIPLSKNHKNHIWDKGIVTKDATRDAAGVRTYTCDECGATKTEKIPARGTVTIHFNANGGTGKMADIAKPYGTKLTIPATTFQRCGYRQLGWVLYRHSDKAFNFGGNGWSSSQKISSDAWTFDYYDRTGDWTFAVNPSWYNNTEKDVTNEEFTFYAVWTTCTHSFDKWVPESMFYHQRVCSVCGQLEPVDRNDDSYYHQLDEGKVTREPSCIDVGEITYTCTFCGASFPNDIGYTYHQWDEGKVTREPSCIDAGEITYTCTVCGESYSNDIGHTDHQWDEGKVTQPPTCMGEGIFTYTCTVCGATTIEYIDVPIDHTWDDGVITVAATCLEPGIKTYTCIVCGEIREEVIPSPATHQWNDGKVTKPATCKEEGEKQVVCAVCGTEKTEIIPKNDDHQWDSGKVTKPATEKTEGVKTYTCSLCGAKKTEPIPIPVPSVVDPDKPTITVGSVTARAGEEVEVPVSITNNPGINTFSLGLDYDTAKLQLKGVAADPGLGGQFTFKEKAVWLNAKDTSYNGTILTLTFAVPADAKEEDIAVAVTYEPGEIANLKEEDVAFQLVPGKISVHAYTPGDINGDNKVNNKDLTRLMKYLAGDAVTVSADALDVNRDGKVNNKDLTRLMKYLAGDNVSIY